MSITVTLPPEIEQRIRESAAKNDVPVEDYVRAILTRKSNGAAEAVAASRQPVSAEEFERLLDELSEPTSFPRLPADFSRADIYSDHD
jgi:hypothetical protein